MYFSMYFLKYSVAKLETGISERACFDLVHLMTRGAFAII